MKTKVTLITAALGLTVSLAFAGPGGPDGGHGSAPPPLPAGVLALYDTDGDGLLSAAEKTVMRAAIEAEHAAKRAEFIALYDTDGDGVLSAGERAAADAAIKAEKEAES